MVKPDVITVNPACLDYPLWRKLIRDERHRFNKIINVFYNDHRKYDFRQFVVNSMPDAISLNIGNIDHGDWRNVCINQALREVESPYVLFLEQDFIPSNGFWDEVLSKAEHYDVLGYGDMGEWSPEVRLHPAFILIKRPFIEMTKKDFGAYPNKNRDHFAVFTEDLFNILGIRYYDISEVKSWEHLKGLSSNYMLVLEGKQPNYEPDRFKKYVEMAMKADVPQDERFIAWSKLALL